LAHRSLDEYGVDREYGNMGILEYGNMGIWEYGNMGILEYGNMGIWEYWNMGIWEYGNMGIGMGLIGTMTIYIGIWEYTYPIQLIFCEGCVSIGA